VNAATGDQVSDTLNASMEWIRTSRIVRGVVYRGGQVRERNTTGAVLDSCSDNVYEGEGEEQR
jgi:hypothetical protein